MKTQVAGQGVQAFAHIAQSNAALRVLLDFRVVKTTAVVRNGQAQIMRGVGQRHVGARGPGVADHVGQRFLGHAEQRGGVGVRQLHRAAGGGQMHGQGRRAVRAGNGKFPAQVFQSGRQTQVVK
ncbi:hypothetical protein D3C72_2028150 [compost metagenome]